MATVDAGLLPTFSMKKVIHEGRQNKTRGVNTTSGYTTMTASHGALNATSIRQMEPKLKVVIRGTENSMAKVKPNHTWDGILSFMMQNPLVRPTTKRIVERSDKFTKKGTNWFKFDGSPDKTTIDEVHKWFQRLIQDTDILEEAPIDDQDLAEVVAETGAAVTNLFTLFANEEHEEDIVDVGVLRYPDLQHPYFKLYRIQLKAWSDCSRVLFVQKDDNGIAGTFSYMDFSPRDETIAGLRKDKFDQAVADADKMFDKQI